MAELNSPSSTAVVDVPDELVESYVAQGWTRVEKDEPKRKPGRPKSSE